VAGRINSTELLQCIIAQLALDLDLFFTAAKTAHEAATHAENQPDNRYDTLALEASYVAQGQANRAQELRKSIEVYKQLTVPGNAAHAPIRLTSLVTLEDTEGAARRVFMGPVEGGLKISLHGQEVVVITPGAPLGRELLGKTVGDMVEITAGTNRTEYEIVEVC
jgi:transcription elongation GreA/GreB family factor